MTGDGLDLLKPFPPCRFSVNRPVTSHDVYNYLIYIQLYQFVLA